MDRHTLAGRAAAGLACTVAAALAAPTLARANSVGFDIVNRTGSTLRLADIKTSELPPFEIVDGLARRPLKGLLLAPNSDPLHVELLAKDPLGPEYSTQLDFISLEGTRYQMTLHSVNRDGGAAGAVDCAMLSDPHTPCDVDSSSSHPTVRLLDPPGTNRVVSGTDAQRQVSVLWDLCRDGGAGRCSFAGDDAEPQELYAPAQVVGQPILNCGVSSISDTYSFAHTAYSRSSVGVTLGISAKVNAVVALIKAGWTGSWSYTWGASHKFEQDIAIKQVLPDHVAYVELSVPIKRAYGTFTARVNNTTWTLEHVSFDTPDPDRPGRSPIAIQNRPATTLQLQACDKHTGTVTLSRKDVSR